MYDYEKGDNKAVKEAIIEIYEEARVKAMQYYLAKKGLLKYTVQLEEKEVQ